jgi:hypothetical protein
MTTLNARNFGQGMGQGTILNFQKHFPIVPKISFIDRKKYLHFCFSCNQMKHKRNTKK